MTDLTDLTEDQRRLLALRLNRAERPDEPLSATQEQLWFLDRLDPGDPAYDVPFGLELTGPLDVPALRAAVAAVVARHPALRTTFLERDGELRQRVHERVEVPVAWTDVSDVDDPRAAAREVAAEHARAVFDLAAGPLIAVRLVRIAPLEHLLLVTAHHIVFDATSAAVFCRDLVACYSGRDLPPAASFPRHVAAERRRLTDEVLAGHLAYWREKLAGSPTTSTLPPDHARPPVQTHRGGRHAFTVSREVTAALAERARSAGVTLNAVVATGFGALLRRFTGQDRVLVGMPVAGRQRSDLESVIGSFANMLVLRVDLPDEPIRDLLRRTHRAVAEAHVHQDAPYARVVEAVDPPRDPGHNPLFQAMLSLTDAPIRTEEARGVVFTPVEVDNGLTDFDLFVGLSTVDGGLRGEIGYNADLYLPATIAAVAEEFGRILELSARGAELPARDRVTVASSFTAGPLRAPLELLTGVLRLPLDVELAPYHQVVQHLLTGGGGGAADVVLLRWEDWLRHGTADPWPDLEAALTAHRRTATTPLLVVVCPPSPAAARDVAEYDERLAVLADASDFTALWWTDRAEDLPVAELFDPQADRLGHVPYTPEFFASLALLLVGHLGAAGTPGSDPGERTGDGPKPEGAGDGSVLVEPARGGSSPDGSPGDGSGPVEWELGGSSSGGSAGDGSSAIEQARGGASPDGSAGSGPVGREGGSRAGLEARGLGTPEAVVARLSARRTALSTDEPAVAARTRTEQRLAVLWAEELGVPEVGVTHDFFVLGGHSLLATRLLSRVHGEFGADVSLHALFTHPTVEALARVVDEVGAGGGRTIATAPRDGDLRPSSTQRRLWAIGQLGGDPTRHNTTFAAVLTGELDVTALRAALDDVVARHEVLRTTFAERDGVPVMVVRDRVDPWLDEIDLRDETPRDRAAEVRQEIRAHAKHRYDLAEGPLLRVRLLRTGDTEHHLLVGMHHVVCDNSSWGVLLSELAARYAGRDLPPLDLQFADFAAWQHALLEGDELRPHLDYWRERLRGAPATTDIATDRPRPAERTDKAGRSRTRIDGAAVRELARQAGITPFTVLLSAYAVLLAERGAGPDVVVGVPQAGRNRPELEPLIGCFSDLLPVRVDLRGASFRQVAQRVHRSVVESYRHQDAPFASIVDALGHRRGAHHPVFQCAFNLADLPAEAFTWPGLAVRQVDVPAAGIDFDLFLNLSWEGDELDAVLEHSSDLFTADGGRDLLEDYASRLGELVAAPDVPVVLEPAEDAPVVLRVASTCPVDEASPVLRWWEGRLGLRVRLAALPPGQVVRPLLDPHAGLADGVPVVVLRWQDYLPPDPAPGAVAGFEVRFARLCRALRRFAGDLTVVVVPSEPTSAPWPGVFGHATDRLRALPVRVLETDDPGTALARVAHRHVARPVDTVVVDPARFPGDPVLFTRDQRALGRTVVERGEGFVVDVPDVQALDHLWPLDEPGPGGDLVLPAEVIAEIAGPLRTAEGVRRAMTGAPAETKPKLAPRTERERALADVWREVLHVSEIGVHDDFFELGGDSMALIQAAALVSRGDWAITPRELAAMPTIAELCAAEPVAVTAEQGEVTGEFPPTGAQRWFLDLLAPTMAAPEHFNHPYYLVLRRDVPVEHLARAAAALTDHHDALRLRFERTEDGWTAAHGPAGEVAFESHRVGTAHAVPPVLARVQESLRLAGPLTRFVHFGLDDEPDRVLVVCHHLVTDGVSRNLLLEDFQLVLRQLEAGGEPVLPAKTTSYRDWARLLHEYGAGEEVAAELPFWLAQAPGAERLPVDLDGEATFGTLDTAGVVLDSEVTAALREEARRRGVGLSDLLVWAAVRLATDGTDHTEWTIATTGHGRQALSDDVDLSRTLGWFQVLYPVRLPAGTPEEVAARLREVPRGGVGHSLLRAGHPDPAVRDRLSVAPQLTVNYMGAFGFEDVSAADELFEVCRDDLGAVQDPSGRWPYRLDVVGTLVGERLRVDVNYGTQVYRRAAVERLLGRVEGLLVALTNRKG
ncbi:condensation domain-containing protein [Actinosynnema sp. NPDC020468]|uniref:condensation domain-containing protein n=1 Tax=Actinosynnema sp. NPDC020468 TaxID=3154488 RepID=UPI0033FAFBEB